MTTKNILDITNIKAGTKLHCCQKPTELTDILITNSSNEGDLVLDMFMGSGSTGISALQTNRRFIGIEIDKNFYKIAEDRINDFLKN